MGLKRKRSTPTLSSPFSTTSTSSSSDSSSPLPSFYAQTKPLEPPIYSKPTWSFPTYDSENDSKHLNSRTRKRYRDGRPEEGVIYENTMNRLYNAQREHPNASPVICVSSPHVPAVTVQPQRSTLHSFWRIPQQPPPSSMPMVLDPGNVDMQRETRCEDCDGALRHDEAMDTDEDVYMQETSCWECRRRVCDTCAVQGDRRVCLGCASGR